MTQATLQRFYTIYTTTLIDPVQAATCENALLKTHGVDTAGSAIGNTND